MSEFPNTKDITKQVINRLKNCKEMLNIWHGYWLHLQTKADKQYELGNNEQWEAYVESMKYIECIVIKKYGKLTELKEILCKVIIRNSLK